MSKNNNKKSFQGRRRSKQSRLVGFQPIPKLLFPDKMRGSLGFTTMVTLSPAAAALASHVFRLNSIYDPDYTGVGVSVLGWTQIQALYGKYRVLHADVTIEFWPAPSSAGPLRTEFIAVASNDLTLGTSIDVWRAQRHVYREPLFNANGIKHRLHVPIGKVYGVSETSVMIEDNYSSVMNSHPSNGVYLHVGAYNPGGSAVTCTFAVRIDYTFLAELPKALS